MERRSSAWEPVMLPGATSSAAEATVDRRLLIGTAGAFEVGVGVKKGPVATLPLQVHGDVNQFLRAGGQGAEVPGGYGAGAGDQAAGWPVSGMSGVDGGGGLAWREATSTVDDQHEVRDCGPGVEEVVAQFGHQGVLDEWIVRRGKRAGAGEQPHFIGSGVGTGLEAIGGACRWGLTTG